MTFSFLKIIIEKKKIIVQLNQDLIFESKDKILLVLHTKTLTSFWLGEQFCSLTFNEL